MAGLLDYGKKKKGLLGYLLEGILYGKKKKGKTKPGAMDDDAVKRVKDAEKKKKDQLKGL